jgi:hypothetical protein
MQGKSAILRRPDVWFPSWELATGVELNGYFFATVPHVNAIGNLINFGQYNLIQFEAHSLI